MDGARPEGPVTRGDAGSSVGARRETLLRVWRRASLGLLGLFVVAAAVTLLSRPAAWAQGRGVPPGFDVAILSVLLAASVLCLVVARRRIGEWDPSDPALVALATAGVYSLRVSHNLWLVGPGDPLLLRATAWLWIAVLAGTLGLVALGVALRFLGVEDRPGRVIGSGRGGPPPG